LGGVSQRFPHINITVREYYSVEAHRFKRILPIGNVSRRLG
jgi:hypothetical protein